MKTFKTEIILVIIKYNVDAIIRLGFSILILYLFNAVAEGDLKMGYIYTAILVVMWYFSQVAKQMAFIEAHTLATNIKSALAVLLYSKISKLTSYVIKSSEIGKITNLLSSDLGIIEQMLPISMNASNFPVVMVGSTVLLILRLGWPGVIGIALVFLIVPISFCISRSNGSLYQEINIYKDKRVQATTEIIEGIKYIKLYGWEIAFRKIIQGFREKEIMNYKKLSFGKSFERSIGNFIGYLAALIMFIAAHYSDTGLTLSKIFSTL